MEGALPKLLFPWQSITNGSLKNYGILVGFAAGFIIMLLIFSEYVSTVRPSQLFRHSLHLKQEALGPRPNLRHPLQTRSQIRCRPTRTHRPQS